METGSRGVDPADPAGQRGHPEGEVGEADQLAESTWLLSLVPDAGPREVTGQDGACIDEDADERWERYVPL